MLGGLYTYAAVAGLWVENTKRDPIGALEFHFRIQQTITQLLTLAVATFVGFLLALAFLSIETQSESPIVVVLVVTHPESYEGRDEMSKEQSNNSVELKNEKLSITPLVLPELISQECDSVNRELAQMTPGTRNVKSIKSELKNHLLKCAVVAMKGYRGKGSKESVNNFSEENFVVL